jgi:hypothetical protein
MTAALQAMPHPLWMVVTTPTRATNRGETFSSEKGVQQMLDGQIVVAFLRRASRTIAAIYFGGRMKKYLDQRFQELLSGLQTRPMGFCYSRPLVSFARAAMSR